MADGRGRPSPGPLTEEQVLRWADAYRARTGRWPTSDSGAVAGAPGETWEALNRALARGNRGLPGGSSVARLLAERRGKRNKARTPPLTEEQVLRWASAHRARTGRWPSRNSGAVPEAPGESWSAISSALWAGYRGLPGGDTLARLLSRHGRRAGGGRPRRGNK
jgi:hypothetical protein